MGELGAASSGVAVLDISEPVSPVLLAAVPGASPARAIHLSGEHAFVSYENTGTVWDRIFQDAVHGLSTLGRSLPVDGADDTIVRARLLPSATPGLTWALSADGGHTLQEAAPDGSWQRLTTPGTDLVWQTAESAKIHLLR